MNEDAELRADPTVCMLPGGRVSVQSNPTAETRPGGRRELRDGSLLTNPTVGIQSDRGRDQPTCGVHPTAHASSQPSGQRLSGQVSRQVTCGTESTIQMTPGGANKELTCGLNPTVPMLPDRTSEQRTRGLTPTAQNVPAG
ncbi:hypothetical protein DKX38_003751 [Salix brachista]|uniref:Uncharacterized protein n=1 Tax=Salix brachista TaxID=2182728 RepID=A0A5N5N9R1_9ROSI|nr:hypothetical protein DKX38_003751 [Salix brachista]